MEQHARNFTAARMRIVRCESKCQALLRQVADVLSGGTGEFDEERLLRELPESLALPERRVRSAIEAQAGDRKRNVLVQAVSQLRQRKLDDAVKSLNNLLACNKVRLSSIVFPGPCGSDYF